MTTEEDGIVSDLPDGLEFVREVDNFQLDVGANRNSNWGKPFGEVKEVHGRSIRQCIEDMFEVFWGGCKEWPCGFRGVCRTVMWDPLAFCKGDRVTIVHGRSKGHTATVKAVKGHLYRCCLVATDSGALYWKDSPQLDYLDAEDRAYASGCRRVAAAVFVD